MIYGRGRCPPFEARKENRDDNSFDLGWKSAGTINGTDQQDGPMGQFPFWEFNAPPKQRQMDLHPRHDPKLLVKLTFGLSTVHERLDTKKPESGLRVLGFENDFP